MLKSSRFAARQQSIILKIIILAILFFLFGSMGHAESAFTPVNGTVTIINDGIGYQIDPHISEGLITYTSVVDALVEVRYYDLLTGTDASVPQTGSVDYLPDIDGSKIVYTSVTGDSFSIKLFDTNTGEDAITLDPHPTDLREMPAIGGQTVVWSEFGLYADPYISEIFVYDRITGDLTRLTDDTLYDIDASVSPDGSLIVWAKCQDYTNNCHIWKASYNGSGWEVAPLAGNGEQQHPITDGQYIVYSGYQAGNAQDPNIFWQTRDGSVEYEIELPGNQQNLAVDGGLVIFENFNATSSTPNWDLLLYDIASSAEYQVATSNDHELQPDVAVMSDGLVRVVWMQEGRDTEANIYASEFRLPTPDNQPPVIDQISAPLEPVMVGATVSATATFSDPNAADSHTAVLDWGDGSTSSGIVDETFGIGTVSGNHTYTSAGVYVITLTVTDNHDAVATSVFQYVVVYDPSGGFVTGSGWIDSPAGAYTLKPDLTGRAHFGFVSRYQKGASLPSGQTDFQFKAGDLSFRSTAYDWLVIAGAKAQFKGQGAVNGSGEYGFLLTVTDAQLNGGGNVDKFRIKIWDRSSGEVVYDNQIGADETADPSTAIGGGSIVIHK